MRGGANIIWRRSTQAALGAAGALLALTASVSLAQGQAVHTDAGAKSDGGSAADELPDIPSPPDFVEAAHVNQRMRDLASIGHPASEKLIGVYLRPSDLNDFASTGRLGGAIVCRAYLEGEYASAQETKAAFQKIVAALKRESGPLNLPDPDVARILDGYRRATQESFHGGSVTAVAARSEPLIDAPGRYGSKVVATFDVTPPTATSEAARATRRRLGSGSSRRPSG